MPDDIQKIQEAVAWYVKAGALLFLLLALLFVVFMLFSIQRRRKLMAEKKRREAAFHQEILQTQLEIQEQTLKTISEEIHDNIGQVLSLAKLKLNTIDFQKQEMLIEKIADSKNLVSKAIHDLRDLSRSLNTDNIASIGLIAAIGHELEIIRKSNYATIFDVKGEAVKADPQKELIVFRIVQESLNNIIKHAEAKRIKVTAEYSGNRLLLTISDDGKGMEADFPDASKNNNKSLGIRNMRNRAKVIGAFFSIESKPGWGMSVKLEIPLNN